MKKLTISLLCNIPVIVIWVLFIYIIYGFRGIGMFVGFDYVYGKYIYIILYAIGILLFLSIFYLKPLIKKRTIRHFISILLAIIFGVVLYAMELHCDAQFEIFSTEKFIKYPDRRLTMYFDLEENYDIKGYTYDEIKKLLGEPDLSGESSYVYFDSLYNRVSVKFKNGRAVAFGYSE